MEMNEMEISYDFKDKQYDSRDKQKFNFLIMKMSKSKRKFNIDPFVLIEHLLSDHKDDNQEVENDVIASIIVCSLPLVGPLFDCLFLCKTTSKVAY